MNSSGRQNVSGRIGEVLVGTNGVYTLLKRLGAGGMGSVFRARDEDGGEWALKILDRENGRFESYAPRFFREIRVANSIDHPGVVRIHDDGMADDGSPFFVMTLVEGRTISAMAAAVGGVLPIASAVHVAVEILDVLAVAHGAGIIHRDIKPDNAIMTPGGSVALLDFGIARDLLSDEALSVTGASFGTPGFMAPEQALGQHGAVDPRTDVWAVGALLFKLLTGQLVHGHTSRDPVAVLLHRAAHEEPRPIRSVSPEVPSALAAVIDRALRPDPKERWPDAPSMAAALVSATSAVTGDTYAPDPVLPLAEEIPPGEGRDDGVRRRRAGIAVGAVALTTALLANVLLFTRGSAPPKAAEVPEIALPQSAEARAVTATDDSKSHPVEPSAIPSGVPEPEHVPSVRPPPAHSPPPPPRRERGDLASKRCNPPYVTTPEGIREYKPGCI